MLCIINSIDLHFSFVLFLSIYLSIYLSILIQFFISMYSIRYQSFVYTQLNYQTLLFQAIQLSHLFALSLMSKRSIWPIDTTLSGATNPGPECTWERWQWRGTSLSPKVRHYWSLSMRLLCVINRKLVGGVLSVCTEADRVFYSPSRLGFLFFNLIRQFL